MELVDAIKNYSSLALIGMEKNTGKTTTLNYLLWSMRRENGVSITSIGLDGEKTDFVYGNKKPRVFCFTGTLIATARDCLKSFEVVYEIIEETGITSALGEIIIVRTCSCGYVYLAGPATSLGLLKVKEKLALMGSEYFIVDGALSRKSYAKPEICDAIVIATGASYSYDIDKVVNDTESLVKLLSIKESPLNIKAKAMMLINTFEVSIIYKDGSFKGFNDESSLNISGNVIKLMEEGCYLVLKGALTRTVLKRLSAISRNLKGFNIIVKDATNLLIDYKDLSLFKASLGDLMLINKSLVAAVTVNPFSQNGMDFDEKELLYSMKKRLKVPVFNVLGGNYNELFK